MAILRNLQRTSHVARLERKNYRQKSTSSLQLSLPRKPWMASTEQHILAGLMSAGPASILSDFDLQILCPSSLRFGLARQVSPWPGLQASSFTVFHASIAIHDSCACCY